jgi:hypothetical protein
VNFFRLSTGSWINLDRVLLASLDADGQTLYLYDSCPSPASPSGVHAAVGVKGRDVHDILAILNREDVELRREHALGPQKRRVGP